MPSGEDALSCARLMYPGRHGSVACRVLTERVVVPSRSSRARVYRTALPERPVAGFPPLSRYLTVVGTSARRVGAAGRAGAIVSAAGATVEVSVHPPANSASSAEAARKRGVRVCISMGP